MDALAGGLVLAALLGIMVAAFMWQGGRRRGGEAVTYVVADAARFVHARLEPATAARVSPATVRRVLEWQLEYQQVLAPRAGVHPVLGSGEAIEHVLVRADEQGVVVDARDVAEIIAADVEYLVSIEAVGAPAGDAE